MQHYLWLRLRLRLGIFMLGFDLSHIFSSSAFGVVARNIHVNSVSMELDVVDIMFAVKPEAHKE